MNTTMEVIEESWKEVVNLYHHLNTTLTWKDIVLYTSVPILSWWTYKILIKPYFSPLRKLPGPPYIPIVGNMFSALKKEAMTNTLEWMKAADSKFIRYYHLYGECRLLVADPEIIKYINITNWQNYHHPVRSPIRTRFQRFILSTRGEEHKSLKKLLNPTFGRIVVDRFCDKFSQLTNEMLDDWNDQLASQDSCIIEVQNYMSRLTLDAICECGFGYKMNSVKNPDEVGVHCFRRILLDFRVRLVQMIPFINKLPFPSSIQKKEDNEFFWRTIRTVCDRKKENLLKTGNKGDGKDKDDLLSLLLKARDETNTQLPDKVILDNTAGFLFAGFETTSSSLTWILLNLSEYPEIQEKVRKEIVSVFPANDSAVNPNRFDELPYLNCVIHESLRLFPPVTTYPRQAINDDVINGYTIPAGTIIGISVSGLHRHPDNWKDPEKFIPERFLEDPDMHKFMPFGAGPLMCIGKRFAMAETQTVLILLLRKFRFHKIPDYKYQRVQNLTMVPEPAMKLRIERI